MTHQKQIHQSSLHITASNLPNSSWLPLPITIQVPTSISNWTQATWDGGQIPFLSRSHRTHAADRDLILPPRCELLVMWEKLPIGKCRGNEGLCKDAICKYNTSMMSVTLPNFYICKTFRSKQKSFSHKKNLEANLHPSVMIALHFANKTPIT